MAYSDASRTLDVKGTITYTDAATQAITSTHISSFTVNEDAGRDVPVGAAPAASFELTLDNSSGQWDPGGSVLGAHVLDGAKVELELGLWNGSAFDYSDIGTYYVEAVQGQEHETLIKLSGSDAMIALMSEYYADAAGDYPQTLASLLADVAAAAGVTLESSVFTNSTVSIPSQPKWRNDLTCRLAAGYIAACAGGIARFNRGGKLEIVTLEKASSRSIGTSVYKTFTRGDTSFGGLNAINIYTYGAPSGTAASRYATTPATPDTSLNSINIKDNPILAYGSGAVATIGAGLLSALTGIAFRGATFEWHGDPAMELGELCTVTDLAATAVPVLITKQTLTFGPGFGMNSGCEVTASTKADANAKLQKIFTPTGNLNAEALAGNIYVRAGELMTLESGGNMNVLGGAEINIAAGGKLTLSSGGDVEIGADTLTDLLAAAGSVQTTIWYQPGTPASPATGDLWYDTDASPVTIKRWDGSSWVDITTTALSQALTAASNAQSTADGKIKAWADPSAPTAEATGDLWIDTDDNNKMYRWSGAAWTLYKVASGYVNTSYITIDNSGISIGTGGTFTVGSSNFAIDASGNVTMKGAITADSGKIGGDAGFTIASQKMYTGSKSSFYSNEAGIYIATNGIALGGNGTTTPFKVTSDGALTASNATITGAVTATSGSFTGSLYSSSGTIGGFTLATGKLEASPSGKPKLTLDSANGTITTGYLLIQGGVGTAGTQLRSSSAYPLEIMTNDCLQFGDVTYGRSDVIIDTTDQIITVNDDTFFYGDVTVYGVLDYTPAYTGKNALAEIRSVRNDKDGNIDHTTLPAFARKTLTINVLDEKGKPVKDKTGKTVTEQKPGRNLGAMISILTKAIQELDARLDKLEATSGQSI